MTDAPQPKKQISNISEENLLNFEVSYCLSCPCLSRPYSGFSNRCRFSSHSSFFSLICSLVLTQNLLVVSTCLDFLRNVQPSSVKYFVFEGELESQSENTIHWGCFTVFVAYQQLNCWLEDLVVIKTDLHVLFIPLIKVKISHLLPRLSPGISSLMSAAAELCSETFFC